MASRWCWSAALAFIVLTATATGGDGFELVDGDRVVALGGTFVERSIACNYDETRFSLRWPDRNIVFRNLGWSGDTVWADARAGFDKPADGFRRMTELVRSLKPTVVVVAYGANEAYAGPEGEERFREGLESLLEMVAATGARVVFVSPIRLEDFGPPLPNPVTQNGRLGPYISILREAAGARGGAWVDLFANLPAPAGGHLTDNGIHLNAAGYWQAARVTEEQLRLPPLAAWQVAIDLADTPGVITAVGTQVDLQPGLEFTALDERLPPPASPDPASTEAEAGRRLTITGLKPGRYALSIDDIAIHTATADEWAAGVTITAGPEFNATEKLRETIRDKNELFFYRWRPQNETYLLGFRKYEQGQNAKEIVEFEPLIAEKEAQIALLRRPVRHLYRLTKEVAQ